MSGYAIASGVTVVPPFIVPLAATLPSLTVVNNSVRLPMPYAATIKSVWVSARTLVSGSLTLTVTNQSAATVATLTLNAAGLLQGTVVIPAVAAADTLSINITGIGVGLADVVVTIWLQMA